MGSPARAAVAALVATGPRLVRWVTGLASGGGSPPVGWWRGRFGGPRTLAATPYDWAGLPRSDVSLEPVGESRFLQVSAGQGQDEVHNLCFGCIDPKAIQAEKEEHGLEGDPLIPIHEWMIAGDAEAVGGGQGGQVSIGIVSVPVGSTLQGREEKTFVPYAGSPSVCLDLIRVNRQDEYRLEPARLLHFASARMALRKFLAPSA